MNFNNKVVRVFDSKGKMVNIISIKSALLLIYKNRAKIVTKQKRYITLPKTIKLNYQIDKIKKYMPWSHKNVKIRDNYTCVYCGKENLKGINCTIDHVIPKSRGGKDTFENTVCSCKPCNNMVKCDYLMEEIDLRFYNENYKPYKLTHSEYIKKLDTLIKR